MKEPVQNSVAIGGVGGSGTRLIASLVDRMGFFLGDNLNRELDNLYFTLLFKRPVWFQAFPTDSEVYRAITLFRTVMTAGLSGQASPQENEYIQEIAGQLRLAPIPLGVDRSTAAKMLNSKPSDLAGRIGWGWKEPNTHIFLPQLAAKMENMKYIHVLRNGLDVAFGQNWQQAHNWSLYIRNTAFDRDASLPRQSLDFWIAANRRAIDFGTEKLGDRFLLLNYDSLCRRPLEELQLLADFLEVRLSNQAYEYLVPQIAPQSIGRWKRHDIAKFSDEQIDAVRDLGFDVDR